MEEQEEEDEENALSMMPGRRPFRPQNSRSPLRGGNKLTAMGFGGSRMNARLPVPSARS